MKNKEIGFYPADILIPKNIDMKKWSVVACDQYTSQPEYWERVRSFIGNEPSTLKIMLPEVDLEHSDPAPIRDQMTEYLNNDVFRCFENSFIFVRRTQNNGKDRCGLIGALDLECYDYRKGSKTLCRATEGTVEERLPPRIRIREGAAIEMPHIMVLIDDPRYKVIEALNEKTHDFKKIYDFELMEKGGHICGYVVSGSETDAISGEIEKLMGNDAEPLLYAVGDGNHSLATAKSCYEKLKAQYGEEAKNMPARYCLIELVNIHSPALEFEPIHRVIFDTDTNALLKFLAEAGMEAGSAHPQLLELVVNGKHYPYSFAKETAKLTVGTLQNALDTFLAENRGTIDYIHGADTVDTLSMKENSIGFILPNMDKSDLFRSVVADGALPRKTFSMGEAHDKRFYLECRRIK